MIAGGERDRIGGRIVRSMSSLIAAVLVAGVLVAAHPANAASTSSDDETGIVAFADGTTRLAGADRYGTAVAISQRYAPGARVAYVATGLDYPDALSAAAAAGRAGGPLLLTRATVLPDDVRAELERLRPGRIVVVGGPSVVSAAVKRELAKIAPTKRVAGGDRYETSARVVEAAFATAPVVFLATGRAFPDALSASGAAGAIDAPVLLVNGAAATLPATTLTWLRARKTTTVAIAGGDGAVSSGVQAQLLRAGFTVERHAGQSRYETAAALNEAYFAPGASPTVLLATGTDFPDALAGAALAGAIGAPLHITARSCVSAASRTAITAFGASSRVVLGGKGVIGSAAAGLQPCTPPDESRLEPTWKTSGWTLDPTVPLPYADRAPVNVRAADQTVDATGLRVYNRRQGGGRADHPVAYAQYGISALMEYERTGDDLWLHRAVRQAERLIEMRTIRGEAWWYSYPFAWNYGTRTLRPPWWSAMAQGQALSLFVRLGQATGAQRWGVAAERTWNSFVQPRTTDGPWSSLIKNGNLYLEEYAGNQKPLLVLNGQIFAMFGVHDYWRATGDPEAAAVFDGAATTVLAMMLKIRKPGDVSYYCVDTEFCATPSWQNQTYHVIHSWQLDTLAALTGDERFAGWAQTPRDDWSPVARRSIGDPALDVDLLDPEDW